MSDDTKTFDPTDRAPAEGERQDAPAADQGKAPHIDPHAKDEPAEGGRDEVESIPTGQ